MLEYHPPGADPAQEQTQARSRPQGADLPRAVASMLEDTGNKRAVRILLECILVLLRFGVSRRHVSAWIEYMVYNQVVLSSIYTNLGPRLHQASESTMRQICNDASDTVLIEIDGVAPECCSTFK